MAAADALFPQARSDLPGGVVLVARGDTIVYQRSFGGADLEQGTPISADTRFHVASVSKQFTAFAAALLAHEGRLDLDADIRTYLPELPDYGSPIRVRHLIHHISGLRDQWDLTMLSGVNLSSLISQDGLLAIIGAQRSLNFAPGSEYRYSNSGYTLLAEIVARRSGMPFRRFLQERVFTPLGMAQTLVYDNAAELVPGRAQSYRVTPQGRAEIVRLNFDNYGATSLFTTAGDLRKWSRELMHPRIFPPDLIRSLSRPVRLNDGTELNYGFGMTRAPVSGLTAVFHGGSDAGFRAFIANYPDRDATIIILSNAAADVGRLHQALADIFLDPPSKVAVVAPPADLTGFAGRYASSWAPTMELRVDDGRLVRMASSGPQAATFRDDGSVAFGTSVTPFRPVRDASGQVIAIEEWPAGVPSVRYNRIAIARPATAELAQLAGEYRSHEVDTTIRVSLDGETLALSTLSSTHKSPLLPLDRDRFETFGGLVTFRRDASGRVTALDVTTGRVRNLRYARQ